MSSPAQAGPSVPKDKEKKVFGKVLSRVKTVLKKADRRKSTLSTKGTTATDAVIAEDVTSEPAPAPAPASVPVETPAAAVAPAVETKKIPRSEIYAERAKKLGEQYGLELKLSEWHSTEGYVLRVEKPIKMRVHRKCHVCNASFGAGKECTKCKHQRCKQCPRVPPKRTEAEKEESRKKRAAMLKQRSENPPIIPDWDTSEKKVVLRRPAKTGGQDLVYRKPRQRVRRTCCQCDRLFASHTKTCDGCAHSRCTDCPRDPSKKDKYPYGYPGDAPGVKIGHYQCHDCKTIYSAPPSEDAACTKCKHRNCASCDRLTPRKVDPEPDPEVWKSVQAKLEGLKLT